MEKTPTALKDNSIYTQLAHVVTNIENTLSIESITQSKLGNKLSGLYYQLRKINDSSNVAFNELVTKIFKL